MPSIDARRRIVIEAVEPQLDCGRYAIKREVGDTVQVSADVFKEGHDAIAAAIHFRPEDETEWREVRMRFVDNDRWGGEFSADRNCRWIYTVVAWTDQFGTWQSDLRKKYDAGQEVLLELFEGARLMARASALAEGADRSAILAALHEMVGDALEVESDDAAWAWADFAAAAASAEERTLAERVAAALDPYLLALMERYPLRDDLTRYDLLLPLQVDRVAARYAAWYELFPRSMSDDPARHGTWDDVIRKLPYVRDMGFDVLYFPPIHPIGRKFRKGKNNTLNPGPDEPGVPYAIGGEEGGHTAIHPDLGSLEDFKRMVAAAREHGLEVALDFAIQVSPDHPYAKEHPDWFFIRPDGTIQYAENPPKKYQDIYPLNFYGGDWEAQWQEWRDVILHWVEQGVKIFRVDNPHTKPVQFWEWMIREVQREHPEVIFLSEAFTRPKMMRVLAKVGFTQSYTYFTWRNFKGELIEYFTELTQGPMKEYYRGNLFPNTPDINPEFLQRGGRPAFMIRAVLATTLSSVYGIYSGFELCEATPLAPGKEEYLDSEKYEIRAWDWDRPGNIRPLVTRLNQIRRANPALQEYDNLRFYGADNGAVLFYGKASADRTSLVFVAVSLDPFSPQEGNLHFPLDQIGIGWNDPWEVEELLTGERHFWQGGTHWLRLEPDAPARIFRVRAWRSSEHGFDYFMEPTLRVMRPPHISSRQVAALAIAAGLIAGCRPLHAQGDVPSGWRLVPATTSMDSGGTCANLSGDEWAVALDEDGEVRIERAVRTSSPTELRVQGGRLIGVDRGEWGGTLDWVPDSGAPVQLRDGNIRAIAELSGRYLAIGGVAHLSTNAGSVVWVRRLDARSWSVQPLAELSAAPAAIANAGEDELLVVTHGALEIVRADGAHRILHRNPVWAFLYPNSVVLTRSGVIYVGMRFAVARLTPLGLDLRESWLVQGEC